MVELAVVRGMPECSYDVRQHRHTVHESDEYNGKGTCIKQTRMVILWCAAKTKKYMMLDIAVSLTDICFFRKGG